jgi:hypothetical protein
MIGFCDYTLKMYEDNDDELIKMFKKLPLEDEDKQFLHREFVKSVMKIELNNEWKVIFHEIHVSNREKKL